MTPIDVINYWYSDRIKKHWFTSTPELDLEIKNKYEQIWERAADGEFDQWKTTPEGCLALVIILDQFPLNMYRSKAKSFQTESKAIEVTMNAINNDFAKKLSNDKLSFLFMPLMHSEDIEDQYLSVKLFKEYNQSNNLRFAQHHRDIIKRFGRFPHRNSILMREPTKEEGEYMSSKNAFKG